MFSPIYLFVVCVGVKELLQGTPELRAFDPQYKTDGIHDIGFSATIWPNDSSESVEWSNFLLASVRLEIFDFKPFDPTLWTTRQAWHPLCQIRRSHQYAADTWYNLVQREWSVRDSCVRSRSGQLLSDSTLLGSVKIISSILQTTATLERAQRRSLGRLAYFKNSKTPCRTSHCIVSNKTDSSSQCL